MTDRRTARSRKVVDYTKFGDPDNFDDDFADLTPPAKKQKISNKDTQKRLADIKDKRKSNKRAPLSEKVYERALQEALELSLLESQGSTSSDIKDDDDDFKPNNSKKPTSSKTDKTLTEKPKTVSGIENNNKKNKIICTVDVIEEINGDLVESVVGLNEGEIQDGEKLRQDEKKVKKSPLAVNRENNKILSEIQTNKTDGNDSDGIVVLDEEQEQVTGRGGRRRSASKVKVTLDESDDDESYFDDEEGTDSSDDDYDEDNDSDFDCGSKKKKIPENKKAAAAPKQTKQTKQSGTASKKSSTTTPKSAKSLKTAVKPEIANKGPLSSQAILSKPVVKSPASRPSLNSPVVHSAPKWNPPGTVGSTNSRSSAVCLKSPSSGVRVGLSRNQRVKSLHPGLMGKNS